MYKAVLKIYSEGGSIEAAFEEVGVDATQSPEQQSLQGLALQPQKL